MASSRDAGEHLLIVDAPPLVVEVGEAAPAPRGGSRGRSSRRGAGGAGILGSSRRRGLLGFALVAHLRIETAPTRPGRVIELTGELDLAGAERARAGARAAWRPTGPRRVVLDLRGVEFMDSSGLRAIVIGDAACARATAGGLRSCRGKNK